MYIIIYIHTYIYIYTYIGIYIYAYIYIYIPIYVYIYIYICVCVYMYVYIWHWWHIGIWRLSVILTKVLCDVNKKTKVKSSRLIYKNVTKQKSRYSLFVNIESGEGNIGSRYIDLNQKLLYSLSMKLKS